MMKRLYLRVVLLVPLLFVFPDSSIAQVSTPPVPNTSEQTTVPAANTTSSNPTTDTPDRRHWPKPTMDNAKFGLLLFDNLEYQGSDTFRWDVYGWQGGDYHRLWIKSEGSQSTGADNDNEADVQLLYGKLIFPFVDLQIGGRVASVWGGGTRAARAFAVLGLQALTPYGFDIEPQLFLSHKGKLSARFTGTYDVLLSQKLIFQPRLETSLAAQPDREFRVGSGFNDAEIGVRFRYEVRREFAPYVGVLWRQNFGETKTLHLLNGPQRQGFSVVFGLRMWK